jgi:two-component system, chemotaxis family, protein-glutamate methylesterase/glutaminase
VVPDLINRKSALLAANAVDGEPVEAGRIYTAPPDHHLVLNSGHIELSHGPRENLHRPCINIMFRSAAATYGQRVAGVLLTGFLDDDAAGLWEIQQRGGATIVQDPREATFSSMPESAIHGLNVQYIVRLDEMAPLLKRLAMNPKGNSSSPEPDAEPAIAACGQTCATCGGSMSKVRMGALREYRCHIGHRFGTKTMLAEKQAAVERAVETALAQSEELIALLENVMLEAEPDSREQIQESLARRHEEQRTLRSLADK